MEKKETTYSVLTQIVNWVRNLFAKKTDVKIYIGTCTTAAATNPKICTVEEFPTVTNNGVTEPVVGTVIGVKFNVTNTSTSTTPELNVNSTGAYRIWYNNAVLATAKSPFAGYAHRYNYYVWDGEYWVFLSHGVDNNTTYANYSFGNGLAVQNNTAEATAITATYASYALTANGRVSVVFTHDVLANSTLNINSKGAKSIYYYKEGVLSPIEANMIKAHDVATFVYNGTYYVYVSKWFSGSYNDLKDKPTKVSEFTNDSGYLTVETDPTVPSWAKQPTKPSYASNEIIDSNVGGTIDQTMSSMQTNINNKVDKETGKGLSTNDYTTTEKTKLAGIEAGAEVNVQGDWAQNDTTADDYIKNRTHYVENISTSDVWYQTGCSIGSGTTSPGGYPATFNITTGDKYNVTISQGSNSKTYEGLTAEYDSVFNGLALKKNWSDSMGMSDTSTDALLLVVQPSNVVLRSADIYGENCTVQVSEVTETIHKLDPKYLPDNVNQLDSITTSKSGKVTTVTFEQTNGTETQFQVTDGNDGTNGKSAYQVAVDNGYSGTEAQWLASLKGADGVSLGEVELTQEVTQDTDKVPSDKAVYNEVSYPDVVYEKAQDIEGWQTKTSITISAPNWYFISSNNYACSGLVDVRNYDTVTWRVFTTNTSYYTVILDKNKAYITMVRISTAAINRQTYSEMGYVFFYCNNATYNNNDTVNLTLSDGHRIKDDIEETRRDVNQGIANSFNVYTPITFYEGERLTNKTIVIFANQNGGTPSLMTGTINVQKNNANYITITGMTSYRDDAKQSISLVLCFDGEGNMNAYVNGVLRGTAPHTSYPDTGWKLSMTYGALFSHFSLINADLSNYISVIENQGWENWMPNDPFILESGKTYSGTTTKGGWVAPQAFPINALIMATVTATNETSSTTLFYFNNLTPYPSGSISVPAGESVTFTRLIDVKTQRSIGSFGNANQAGWSTVWSAYQVGFIWGLDYRYAHSRGAYNLNGLVYDDYPIVLSVKEIVPQVLATGAAGSAVGQIRVDANGNLQMYNGTTWKQINNS